MPKEIEKGLNQKKRNRSDYDDQNNNKFDEKIQNCFMALAKARLSLPAYNKGFGGVAFESAVTSAAHLGIEELMKLVADQHSLFVNNSDDFEAMIKLFIMSETALKSIESGLEHSSNLAHFVEVIPISKKVRQIGLFAAKEASEAMGINMVDHNNKTGSYLDELQQCFDEVSRLNSRSLNANCLIL